MDPLNLRFHGPPRNKELGEDGCGEGAGECDRVPACRTSQVPAARVRWARGAQRQTQHWETSLRLGALGGGRRLERGEVKITWPVLATFDKTFLTSPEPDMVPHAPSTSLCESWVHEDPDLLCILPVSPHPTCFSGSHVRSETHERSPLSGHCPPHCQLPTPLSLV